jgi:poly-beta-1,6-N-acetyl-D-glucosamine synthase
MILLIITIALFILYSILLIYYWQSWKAAPEFVLRNPSPQTRISVIIPARNEEENIGLLLQALQQQTYPKELFEIIVVDDHSADKTAAIVQQFPSIQLLQLKEDGINSYKKKAIETGIAIATGDLIVTTDADCVPPKEWLRVIAGFKETTHAVFIVAPVMLRPISHSPAGERRSILSVFQQLDFMVLQGITAASVYKKIHSMCNGANLANDVHGFRGIDHIASGDDMLLMHKIGKQYPGRIHYLKSKEVIVATQPMKTWKEFFNQRIRWASKASQYDDKRIVVLLWLVYLFNLSFLALLVAGFWNYPYWVYAMIYWVLKTFVELPFCNSIAEFFHQQRVIGYFFFLQPLHIFYTIISGLLGQFGKYEWKGRRVR